MKITLEDITAVELLAVAKVLNNINDEVITPSNAPIVVSTDDVAEEPVGDTIDFDKEGLPWDERIHSSNHKLTGQGVWMRRRGVSDEVYNSVKAELLGKWEAAEPITVEDNNPHLETTILAPAFEPVQAPAPVAAPAPIPAPTFESSQAPVAAPAPVVAPAPVAPTAPAPTTFETFSSKLQYALANKLIEANYMQGVLNSVNATFGTNYQGMFEMRDNENAMLFVINELAKKGI